ncbi:TPA: phage antirepressor N-terminal domain-containing protein [Klebsiella pneumoniae]|nr:phage antirepressor N-terminal domain-containing protein [Klebsiella pneumoniae]
MPNHKNDEAPMAATIEASNLSVSTKELTNMSIATAVSTINVPFYGSNLYVVSVDNEAYTPMRPIIDGMGLTYQGQADKLKSRFAKGVREIMIPTKGGEQTMLCLALRKLNGWLQTISPNKVRPEIRDSVIRYQEECDDVLYEYWTKGEVKNPRKKTTVDERTPLRDAVNMLVSKRHMMYPEAYAMIHQRFNVDSIEDLEVSQIPTAIEYVHRVALEGEFLGKQETLPAPKFDVNIPLQWWIDNNPLVRSGNLSFGRGCTAPALDVTMDMLCGDNSTSAAIRLINVLEEAGFDVSAPKAEIVAMRKHLGNVEYGMKAIADACRRAGNKTISFRGGKAEYVIG